MTEAQITECLSNIRTAMDKNVSVDNPSEVSEKLERLTNLLGTSAECIAQSRRYYDFKLGTMLKAGMFRGESATDKKMLMAMEASAEIYLVNYSESLNKDLHYCIEGLRTIISLLKSEINKI